MAIYLAPTIKFVETHGAGDMNLNNLLRDGGFNPAEVVVFRHRPQEPKLRSVLPWLAAEKPDVFNAYQQTHGEKVENALLNAKYVASFIGHAPGKAVFVGLYEIGATRELTDEDYWAIPAYQEMHSSYEMIGFGRSRSKVLWFDMPLTEFYARWAGKLVVRWPPPERSWWRRAHKNDIQIEAILEQSIFSEKMPAWNELVLSWSEIAVMPSVWKAAIAQWRGVYFIFDESDGKGYVGSAYGSENILGRWMNYAASGHGGNALLRRRDPRHFSFSIIERVSPDMLADDVIRLEARWKERLHTRAPYGLNDN